MKEKIREKKREAGRKQGEEQKRNEAEDYTCYIRESLDYRRKRLHRALQHLHFLSYSKISIVVHPAVSNRSPSIKHHYIDTHTHTHHRTISRIMGKLKYLTAEQKKFYDENGYVKLCGVFSDEEFREIEAEYQLLFDRKERENASQLEAAWVGDDMRRAANNVDYTVKSIHNLQMHSAVFSRLLLNPRLLDAMEDILDTPDILLHHTKAHIKPPERGAPYLMHQDYPYFPFKNHTMCAVFLHLDDTTPTNGGLCVYPGSQKLGPIPERVIVDERGEKYLYVDPERYPISGAKPVEARKGEIIVFSYLLLHGSYLNLSDRPRRMFLAQLRAADDEPAKELHHSHCQNLALRGRNCKFEANMATRFVDSGKNN